jgi:Transglycosylase SLT domain/SPOR domain
MPQGMLGAGSLGRASRRIRKFCGDRGLGPRVLLFCALGLLAACGGQKPQVDPYAGQYNRPSSYAPPGPPEDPWGPYIRQASRRFDVPERWIREVMRQESGGRTMATSPVGAMGLMQVMPGTYRQLRNKYGLGDDPYHPYDSIMSGTAYLREMYDLYGTPAFLAAYNAGPKRLEDYLWGNRGLPNETRNYVARIGPRIVGHHPRRPVSPEIAAAGDIPLYIPRGPRRMDSGTMMALREQRRSGGSEPDIQVAQLPPGTVVRMEPIGDNSRASAFGPPPTDPPFRIAAAAPVAAPVAMPAPVAAAVPPPGSVIAMEPIPDGSTGPSPRGRRSAEPSLADASASETAALVALAAAQAAAAPPSPLPLPQPVAPVAVPSAVLSAPEPEPEAPPPAPARRQSAAKAAPARERPAPEPRPAALAMTAPLPTPPSVPLERRPEPAMTVAGLFAAPSRAAPPMPTPDKGRSAGLVGAAQAASLRLPVPPPAPTPAAKADRAVQLGAYTDRAGAERAAREAQAAAGGGAAAVVPVQQGRSMVYRAKVTGLSDAAAKQACDRLRRQGSCEAVHN